MIALRILPWALFAVAFAWGGNQWLTRWDQTGVLEFQTAYGSFLRDLTQEKCTTLEAVMAVAQARGWAVESAGAPNAIFTSNGAVSWAVVHVQPGMPFSKEPGVRFAFDAQGCSVAWSY